MLRKLASRPDWQIAILATAALRVFYTAIAAAFLLFLHPDPTRIQSNALTENLPAPHGLHYALIGIWERFDTLWFLRISEHGYDRRLPDCDCDTERHPDAWPRLHSGPYDRTLNRDWRRQLRSQRQCTDDRRRNAG